MMMSRRATAACVLLCAGLLCPSFARAATISGTVRNTGGTGIAGIEVSLWTLGVKGWAKTFVATTDGAGAYSFGGAPADDYKVFARMSNGMTGNYGDRWYDTDGDGYIGEEADVLTVGAADNVTGIDFVLEVLGGMDGRVITAGATLLPGMWVRAERGSDYRIHHNDQSQGSPHLGEFYMRGLVPGDDYQFIVYDPNGNYATTIDLGPVSVTSGMNEILASLIMNTPLADPYEPNNTAGGCPGAIDTAGFDESPPQPWESVNAYIGPRNADLDWYCYAVSLGDRYIVTATTELTVGANQRYHPWTDPDISVWSGGGATLMSADDDSGPGPFDSQIDTGVVAADDCYCVAVTTYGDRGDGLWNAALQQSAGAYVLRIEMGNRPPTLAVTESATPVTEPITIDEGETVVFDLAYSDPDGDPLSVTATHLDAGAAAVTDGTLVAGAAAGTYTWTPNSTAATGSPYTVEFAVDDAEFEITQTVTIIVNTVNEPPTAPTLVSPADDALVSSETAPLVVGNGSDPDFDSLSYQYEVYYDNTLGVPDQTATVPENASGETTWTTDTIADDTLVFWRARTSDGVGGLSPWTGFWKFFVDTVNTPPPAPVLTKPAEGETVAVRRPTLSVNNVIEPEGDAVEFHFEVSDTSDFANLVASSDAVPQDELAGTTVWQVDTDLDWGANYFARARATDDRGGTSADSNINGFRVKDNVVPDAPQVAGGVGCDDHVFADAPSALVVNNVTDPEGETVTFELEIFAIEDDPNTATPLIAASATQDDAGSTTEIAFDGAGLEPGASYRYRVRAFDGTGASMWVSCTFSIEGDGGGGGGGGADASGCCRIGDASPAEDQLPTALLVLFVAVALYRRRR